MGKADPSASTRSIGLLMTRRPADSDRFLALLPQDLLDTLNVIHAPLLQIQPLSVEPVIADLGGVIFTSANGVASSPPPAQRLPAYCVGKRTTKAARERGWGAVCSGANADELVAHLTSQMPKGPLLHLHGQHTRGNVAQRLSAAGLTCEGLTVYEQKLLPLEPAQRAEIAAQNNVIVPLFSPRTARHFASLGLDQMNLTLIALSEAVASELKGLQSKGLQVSKAPVAESMAALVRDAAVRLAHLEGDNPAQ